MADLPADFDSIEHLQKTYQLEYNKRVDRYFKDVEGPGNLDTVRGSVKLACRALDNDNQYATDLRHKLFFDVLGYGRKNLAVVYGSKFDTAPPVAGHPQLFLHFTQDAAAQPDEEPLVEHTKSCRLMKFSCSTDGVEPAITKANMTEIANEIKTLFLDNKKGITYTTGNKSASYTDPDNGFPRGNYLLVNAKSDAISIYGKMCGAIDVPFHENKVLLNDPDRPSTTTATAGTTTILGKQQKKRRYRPVALLRFRTAYISLGNLVPPVFLIDTTFRNQSLVHWW
jgi:hypothetical protein